MSVENEGTSYALECGPPVPMVSEPERTPQAVREICDGWVDSRVEWFSDEDLDNPRLWWDVASQVLATGADKVSMVNAQLLASALFKLAAMRKMERAEQGI